MDKVRLRLNKDEATIVEGEDSFVGQIIAAGRRVKIKTPFVRREIHAVKNKEGKVIDKGNIGKPTKEKTPE